MDEVYREAVRILVVDEDSRLLLFRNSDDSWPRPYWLTPGGGVDAGESDREAAARELAEETGLRLPPERLGAPVHRETTRYTLHGRRYVQAQRYFLLRAAAFPVRTDGLDDVERRVVVGHRWWPLPDLAATGDDVFPADLPALVTALVHP